LTETAYLDVMRQTIGIGEFIKLKRGLLKGTYSIYYSGMPTADTFAISLIYGYGHNGYSPIFYYPADTKYIKIDKYEVAILEVGPDFITFGNIRPI